MVEVGVEVAVEVVVVVEAFRPTHSSICNKKNRSRKGKYPGVSCSKLAIEAKPRIKFINDEDKLNISKKFEFYLSTL